MNYAKLLNYDATIPRQRRALLVICSRLPAAFPPSPPAIDGIARRNLIGQDLPMTALSALQPLLGGLLTAAILAWIARSLSRSRAAEAVNGTRRITPHRGLLGGLIAGSAALSATALYAAMFHGGDPAAWGVGIVFGLIAIGTLFTFSSAYSVEWDSDVITGPASYGCAPFGPRRGSIAFAEITEIGIDALGSFFVRDRDGLKLRWNWIYRGYEDLHEAIATARPDLVEADLPED
jgi:hypothetical protein